MTTETTTTETTTTEASETAASETAATTENPFTLMAARLGLDETRAAGLMGVPVYTWRKWASGQRQASASAYRVLELLAMMEALAPDLLAALVPVATVKPARSRKKSPGKSDAHVEKVQ